MRNQGHLFGSTISDEELVAACLKDESAAWDALVDRYAALIYSIPLTKYGFGEADAADVFQSVCVTLLDKLDTIREPRGLAAWIITTTSRQCLALVRQRQRERSRAAHDVALVDLSEVIDPDVLPEDEVLALERQYQVRLAVSELPAPCQRLIEALFIDTGEPLSYDQLAARLGVSPNSLGPTRQRCLAKLRRALIATGFTP